MMNTMNTSHTEKKNHFSTNRITDSINKKKQTKKKTTKTNKKQTNHKKHWTFR